MAERRADIHPDNSSGTSLDQFRRALTSQVARRNMGIDLDDTCAGAIAADAERSAGWYKLWCMSESHSSARDVLTDRPVPNRLPAGAHAATVVLGPLGRSNERLESSPTPPAPVLPGHTEEPINDWHRQLPVRFNRPPGWPKPSQDWILQHIGLDISDDRRPPGAPRGALPGWVWWIPQEPAWTAWVSAHSGASRRRAAGTAFGASVGLALPFGLAGWSLLLTVALVCALGSGIALVLAIRVERRFRRDPLGELRDYHSQVAERLRFAAASGDGHDITMADDFPDIGGWFDGD